MDTNGTTPASASNSWTQEELDAIYNILDNVMSSRAQLIDRLQESRRDINHECDYPRSISAQDYQDQFDREPIPARVVECLPAETWRLTPTVYELEEGDKTSPFEEDVKQLHKSLRGTRSWYEESLGSPLWDLFYRLDVVSGIGQYGVLFLGLDDDLPPDQPAVSAPGRKLLFARVFSESMATIESFDSNLKSSRYGQPVMYNMTFHDPNSSFGTAGLNLVTQKVHWTRCIHVADNIKTSPIFGIPRCQQVFNRLLDLRKLYAGSAEMYWRGAFPGFSFESPPQFGGDVEMDTSDAKGKIQEFFWGLQRFLILRGLTAKSLAPQVVDPSPQIERQLESICILLDIPKRIFMGSERGELSSTEDKGKWADRIASRRYVYATNNIVAPFFDRCIELGILREPSSYKVWWPDQGIQSENQKATVALKKTQALVQYVAGGGKTLMPPHEFLTIIMGLTDSEAAMVLAQLEKFLKDEKKRAAADDVIIAGPTQKPEMTVPQKTPPPAESKTGTSGNVDKLKEGEPLRKG